MNQEPLDCGKESLSRDSARFKHRCRQCNRKLCRTSIRISIVAQKPQGQQSVNTTPAMYLHHMLTKVLMQYKTIWPNFSWLYIVE